tara:strand:+ start:290 stop:865 length:576 start_codon:yes stop_codon:yes gene_type:complete
MKNKLIILFLLLLSAVCSAQSNLTYPSKVVLKSGDTLFCLGKFTNKIFKNRTFKYKAHLNAKKKEIELSKIDFVQIRYSKKKIKTFKIFPLTAEGPFIPFQEFIKGEHVEVYGLESMVNSMAVLDYYIKRSDEDQMTYIGGYDAIFGKFKKKVYEYFSDCDLLIKKLEKKELRLRNGLEEIADFYNKNCGK